ncbi:HAD-IB family phosphatase [Candidatus Dojkabacteria bacterium]|nr:HAD-IB family phosphatase [Candidatus Dojkabacteria bacterium]
MDKTKIKLVVFDVDETLTNVNSWQYITREFGVDPKENLAVYQDFAAARISKANAIKQVMALWNRHKHRTKEEFEKVFSSIETKKDAVEVVKYVKSKYDTIIISGALSILVKQIAEKVNIKEWYSLSKLTFKSGKITTFSYPDNESDAKYEIFVKIAKKRKIEAADAVMIGDGNSDYKMFEKLGMSILIESNEDQSKLEQLAAYKVKSLSEIKNIL